MAYKQTEPTEVGELLYDLRSRATVAFNDIRSYGSHKTDPAVEEQSAEGKPETAARVSTEFPRLLPITEIEEESQASGSMPDTQAKQQRDTISLHTKIYFEPETHQQPTKIPKVTV